MVRGRTLRIFDHLDRVGRGVAAVVVDIKAGLDALHRVQFDEPWATVHRPTYEEWQDYIAVRPKPSRPPREAGAPASRSAFRCAD